MTEYSSNFYSESDSGLIEKFEEMLKNRDAYFFDVEEVEAIADYYAERANVKKAKIAVEHGLKLFPNSSALLLKKAQMCVIDKEPKKAMQILNFLEAAEPSNTEMLLFKAVVHRNLSDHEGTKLCLIKALETSPENREEIFLDLAYEQQLADDYPGAIESLKQSLSINPDHDASLFELSYCFEMAEVIEDGIDFFNEYLDEHPYNFVAWYNLALCYEKIGLFEKAVEAADFCLAIREDFVNGHTLKGNLYTSLDMDREALKSYTASLIHDPENPMVYTAIGECHERLDQWSSAETNYKHALSIDPHFPDALMGMGAIKEKEGNMASAIAFFRQAVEKDDFNIDNKHMLAEALTKNNQLSEAYEIYLLMTMDYPDDEESWIQCAELVAMLRSSRDAVEVLREGLDNVPGAFDLSWHLIKHLILSGKRAEAEELFVEIGSDNPDGIKYFLNIFPEALQIANIAGLIEIYEQAQKEDEL